MSAIHPHRRVPPRACSACGRILGPLDDALRARGRLFFCAARTECVRAYHAARAAGRPS